MVNNHNVDLLEASSEDELGLLRVDADQLKAFYTFTGPARKQYIIQMAEAEAERIRTIRQAQADGILAVRRAEAEGLRLIGEALVGCDDREALVRVAALASMQQVAESLANGAATKLIIPQPMGDLFSLLTAWRDSTDKP